METASVQSAGGRILVVDDDPDFLEIVARSLAREGHVVSTAGDVHEAYEAGTRDPPDLILMDVWMPGRSGLQGCALFRETPSTKDVPIILMSGSWHDARQVSRALASGATDVLSKEQQALELGARVRAALRTARLGAELARAERRMAGLREFVAICAGCKHVRNEQGDWEAVEEFLTRDGDKELTHGICPDCRDRLYGEKTGQTPFSG